MSYNANIKREWGEILGYCTIQNIPIPSMFGTETPIIIQKPVTSFFQFLALFLDVFMAATYILWFHSGGRVGILIITWLISHFPGSATSIIIPNLALLPGYSLISFVLKRDQSKKQVVYVWVYYKQRCSSSLNSWHWNSNGYFETACQFWVPWLYFLKSYVYRGQMDLYIIMEYSSCQSIDFLLVMSFILQSLLYSKEASPQPPALNHLMGLMFSCLILVPSPVS